LDQSAAGCCILEAGNDVCFFQRASADQLPERISGTIQAIVTPPLRAASHSLHLGV
jgi:hypothetical protein